MKYPERPITLVVGYAPGGGVDILARLLAGQLSEDLEQKVLIENRPGAASNIAAESVARAAPDGYTLYISTHPRPPRPVEQPQSWMDPAAALAPVALLATVPNVVVTGMRTPVTSIAGLVELAKTYPRLLSYGSPGVGSPPHLLGELFLSRTQTELLHVPYRGGALAIPEVIAGRLDALFISLPGALPHIQAGTVRALAVMSERRALAIDHIPTMEESGVIGMDMETRFGLMAPAGTPEDVIARLNRAVNAVLMNPALQAGFIARGYVAPLGRNTPESFQQLVAAEAAKWDAIPRVDGASGLH
ncbi:tripartite tricarboxylate transporter substrate-binding protein [Bordetella genomosp. 8]|uniref:tripartite tricarboxylate transporter substrate-binding protein n=1 Tax=Bordetella genomosp. 8 TaxID=1416806 RepID=UPI0012FD93FB|nr:tripartite tricarboxylate transporter substrate-binding protein [Bordetella genomosp. 8]